VGGQGHVPDSQLGPGSTRYASLSPRPPLATLTGVQTRQGRRPHAGCKPNRLVASPDEAATAVPTIGGRVIAALLRLHGTQESNNQIPSNPSAKR